MNSEEQFMISFSRRLKSRRKAQGLTQRRLAKLVGVSESAVSHWENRTRVPSIPSVLGLARALEVSLGYLVVG